MGEPFRGPDGELRWFTGADGNGDGALTRAEFEADALRFFAVLDRGKDGEIDPDDMQYYETELFPELRVAGPGGGGGPRAGRAGGGRMGGGRGGGRGGMGGGRMGGGGMGGGGMGGGQGGGDGGGQSDGRTMAAMMGRQGAGRFSYLDIPEPVASADSNFNRGVSAQEFIAAADTRFALLDRNHDGRLTLAELPAIRRGRPATADGGRPVG
jgi:Ca2+-binding EF-hand superfamily protein